MTVYNKLKIAVFAILSSQHAAALVIDPIQVQSAPGELLYAEMAFSQANTHANLEVDLASPEDLIGLGIQHQPPGDLNFFSRRTGQGSGVIVITSSRPLTAKELNIVVKVKEGQATRLQHIKTAIKPQAAPVLASTAKEKLLKPVLVSEKDIALNLPESTQYQVNQAPAPGSSPNSSTQHAKAEIQPLALPILRIQETIRVAKPMPAEAHATAQGNSSAPQTGAIYEAASTTAEVIQQSLTLVNSSGVSQAQPVVQPKPAASVQKPVKDQTQPYKVQNNESLWTIASRIAAQTQQPVATVMQQIKQRNEHAFIHGDVNRLRRGATLNLAAPPVTAAKKLLASQSAPTGQPAAKAKYRLDQAQMSLVAASTPNSAQGNAKKNTDLPQTSTDLALKVMTAREKTVKLQKNVTQLDMALQHKDHRIQLLNARLAQLEQQLKAQQTKK